MEIPVRICKYCKKEFIRYIRPSWIPKGGGKYCSRECFVKALTKRVKTNCAYCGKEIEKQRDRIREYNFCNRTCKEAAQSLKSGNKFKNMRPEHYGKGCGINTYRRDALEFYGEKCTICGYDILCCLEVHHRDKNRKNNGIQNLDVLCATHHREYKFGIRKYPESR
jgi:hypothetical protein